MLLSGGAAHRHGRLESIWFWRRRQNQKIGGDIKWLLDGLWPLPNPSRCRRGEPNSSALFFAGRRAYMREMTDKFPTLSGFWTGVYDYVGAAEPVAFNAMLTESACQVTGESVEPNTFADPSVSELFASLSGSRDADVVCFIKNYEDAPGAGHSVRYEGVVDAKLTKIEGRWSISNGFGFMGSGPFVMNRRDASEAAERSVDAEADLDAQR